MGWDYLSTVSGVFALTFLQISDYCSIKYHRLKVWLKEASLHGGGESFLRQFEWDLHKPPFLFEQPRSLNLSSFQKVILHTTWKIIAFLFIWAMLWHYDPIQTV